MVKWRQNEGRKCGRKSGSVKAREKCMTFDSCHECDWDGVDSAAKPVENLKEASAVDFADLIRHPQNAVNLGKMYNTNPPPPTPPPL